MIICQLTFILFGLYFLILPTYHEYSSKYLKYTATLADYSSKERFRKVSYPIFYYKNECMEELHHHAVVNIWWLKPGQNTILYKHQTKPIQITQIEDMVNALWGAFLVIVGFIMFY